MAMTMTTANLYTVSRIAKKIADMHQIRQDSAVKKIYRAIESGYLETLPQPEEKFRRCTYLCSEEQVEKYLSRFFPKCD